MRLIFGRIPCFTQYNVYNKQILKINIVANFISYYFV